MWLDVMKLIFFIFYSNFHRNDGGFLQQKELTFLFLNESVICESYDIGIVSHIMYCSHIMGYIPLDACLMSQSVSHVTWICNQFLLCTYRSREVCCASGDFGSLHTCRNCGQRCTVVCLEIHT